MPLTGDCSTNGRGSSTIGVTRSIASLMMAAFRDFLHDLYLCTSLLLKIQEKWIALYHSIFVSVWDCNNGIRIYLKPFTTARCWFSLKCCLGSLGWRVHVCMLCEYLKPNISCLYISDFHILWLIQIWFSMLTQRCEWIILFIV